MAKLLALVAVVEIFAYNAHAWVKPMENPNLYEGDMILTPAQQKAIEQGDFGFGSKKNPTELWPNGIVPYELDYAISRQPKAIKALNEAIAQYHKYTCIRFRKRTRERAYIRFFYKDGYGCSSGVGYGGGMASISLDDGCWWRTTVMHEIAHTLGFYHEQSRPDRDSYVEILWKNLPEGAKSQFKKQPYSNVDSRGIPYDYRSMMHYNWNAFGRDQKMTIRTLDSSQQYEIGQREGFSHLDIKQINKVYNCRGTYPTLPPYVPPPAGCYDLGGGCPESKAEGRCTSSSWQSYMRKSCRKTCGFCGNGGTKPTSGTGGGSNCKDGVTDCMKNYRQCTSTNSAWRSYMQRVCRKTCRFC